MDTRTQARPCHQPSQPESAGDEAAPAPPVRPGAPAHADGAEAGEAREPVRVAVVGPTATGKSELALDLLQALGEQAGSACPGVVVNADASQLYRGMDIGTAKLTPAQRRGITHYQLDVLDVTQEASVAAFQAHARADVAAHHALAPTSRVLIVGGSGLYVRSLTDALTFPGTDPGVRARLTGRLEREGADALWAELERADPSSAQRIQATNTRRVVRALEVIEITGRPFSATLPRYEDLTPTVHLALRPVVEGDEGRGRAALGARIMRRAASMFTQGLVEETRALLEAGLREGPTASRAIGYSQAVSVIEGTMTSAEAVEATALATRQLAARQRKWFRRDPRVHWLDLDVNEAGDPLPRAWQAVVDQAAALVRRAPHRP